ncbi:ATP-binding protein [Candidatus Bathyarchaeota archaeon]|nr:MAG: ATP-binding protein [Candidatus Bathyarchaeota archaeon]
MTITNMTIGELTYWNDWWKTEEFPQDDANIRDWSLSAFKWKPRLSKTIEDKEVIYVLRGPRRVGKTTLLKLRIKRLLEEGIPSENIFYFPCDAIETPKQLMTIIDNYLTQKRRQGEWAYLFIDEVSMLIEWQKAIKLLIDAGRFRDCTVILTGSHSIDLRKGSESLSGRRGKIEKLKYGTPDKILLPAKFSEYIETLDPKLANELRKLWLLSLKNRRAMLLQLANGIIPHELERLALFTKELELLLDQYMLTGGIAQATHQYVSKRKIAEGTYATFVNLMVRDICRWKHHENYARQILRRIFEALSSLISWNDLRKGTDIRDSKTAESYVNVLKDSFVVAYYYMLNVEKTSPDYISNKKIYFQDPFIFHACRGWVYGKKAFDLSLNFMSSPENKSKLAECLVGNHLSRFMFNLYPSSLFDPSNYVFYWKSKKREVDFTIRLNNKFLPIEVKYSDNIQKDDARGIYDFMKTDRSHEFGIITSRNRLEVGKRYVVVPLSILLLLA